VKEFLSRAGHPFTVRNVEEDGAAYSELLSLGFRTIPLTVINGTPIKGFDTTALTKALRNAGGS
jgi:hypothetical protein